MKKTVKIKFEAATLEIIIPGAYLLDFLPRKRKKKLKKIVAQKLIEIAMDEALSMEAMIKVELTNKLLISN
jgi:hypothetical protein